ncbi:uncharacterized protein AB675_11522 [Cyphellophora attinorum]|uniref:holo-[acyl-carrier-protein] synthase n=1 Tax=Cyphellophora attinorum TaxID=1664694 RepID=A0A0N1H981_9EURO|nr:uncharacterized protein AB675_11522 [Phialophora attinorum]KPI40082.1 hypothetical protein AB675_11522 [Phialophora attinorum]
MPPSPPLKTAYATPVVRFYVDVRPKIPAGRSGDVDLPLLHSLTEAERAKIQAYMRPADRLMSLASALLKYLFIHRYARIPWDEVRISRTPDPHRRPYWEPGAGSTGDFGLEFNVSHQNGVVVLLGCRTPDEQSQAYTAPITRVLNDSIDGPPLPENAHEQVRLGVDLACANEHGRTPADVTTQAKLDEWVDIFEEMFSDSCRQNMKTAAIPGAASSTDLVQQRFRRFYAFWALKEAFIKMVGEGLLADWLAKLEFENVQAPTPAKADDFPDDGFSWALQDEDELKWTPPEQAIKHIRASLYGKQLNDVNLSLVAFENDFLLATSMHGVQDATEGTPQERWIKLDLERDFRRCAEGKCTCLKQDVVEMAGPLTATGSASTTDAVPYALAPGKAYRLYSCKTVLEKAGSKLFHPLPPQHRPPQTPVFSKHIPPRPQLHHFRSLPVSAFPLKDLNPSNLPSTNPFRISRNIDLRPPPQPLDVFIELDATAIHRVATGNVCDFGVGSDLPFGFGGEGSKVGAVGEVGGEAKVAQRTWSEGSGICA